MRQDVVSATPETPIQEASRRILEHKIGALPVVDDTQVVGIVTRGDLCRLLAAARDWPELRPEAATRVHAHPEVWLA
jgi:CBS domain-containing protein